MLRIIFFFLIFLMSFCLPANACEYCTIPQLGKHEPSVAESKDKKVFVKYLFEYQNWHEKEAGEAHALHHQGHHFHDKIAEYFQHIGIGVNLTERWKVLLEAPYIIRQSIEIDDHTILGTKQRTEGFGDLLLLSDYKLFFEKNQSFSIVGGVKFPTGSTHELNSIGTRFEPEQQLGSGSFDYVLGGVYQQQTERWSLTANTAYVYKTRGDQEYRFGDLLSASLMVDYLWNSEAKHFETRAGLDFNAQYEKKHQEDGVTQADSGGVTLFLGPAFKIAASEHISLFGNVFFPVYQNLGGVHQEIDWISTVGVKVNW